MYKNISCDFGLLCVVVCSFLKTGLWDDNPGFNAHQGQEIFVFCRMSRPALWPVQPPFQRVQDLSQA